MQLRDGAEDRRPRGATTSNDSLLADRTVIVRSDNAVQFSKTIALLGAAGKVSSPSRWRQPTCPAFSTVSCLDALKRPHNERAALLNHRRLGRRRLLDLAYPRVLIRSLVLSMSSRIIVKGIV